MAVKRILITGIAGFIGSNIANKLLQENFDVLGIDNLNDYYDVKLKENRLKNLEGFNNFQFIKVDISNKEKMFSIFNEFKPNIVINLAAQAGVRYSLENPDSYINSNVLGFYNILEACRYNNVEHLLYASSSSVYGENKKVPFSEEDMVDCPVSLYAATKKTNELMAYTYSHLYKIPTTGLRFFTVYGPMGRPDMAYFSFTEKYFNNQEIHIYNNGDFENDLYRDFTYIDDIVEGIYRLIDKIPTTNNLYRILNLGNNTPEKLMTFITTLEKCLSISLCRKIEFRKVFEPIKPGDVKKTYADTSQIETLINFKPSTSIEQGLQNFTDWYVKYYGKN